MKYEEHCRKIFKGADLHIEDLFLLESYQIAYLKERAPQQKLCAVLQANPALKRFFTKKCPEISEFLDDLSCQSDPICDEDLERLGDSLVWEIADMIIYCKQPELYDKRATTAGILANILKVASIKNKIIIDGGAGTGRVTFEVANQAQHVFAVEPNTSMRRFISQKAQEKGIRNVYPIDGFLDAIPLPDGSADLLITSNAIGWRLESELHEIERVVKSGGKAVHMMASSGEEEQRQFYEKLASPNWQYQCVSIDGNNGHRRMYVKCI